MKLLPNPRIAALLLAPGYGYGTSRAVEGETARSEPVNAVVRD